MWNDPIVEEARRIREEHAARFDYDLRAIFEDLRRRQQEGGRSVVSFPPRRVTGDPDRRRPEESNSC
jgi:hypothetical protein